MAFTSRRLQSLFRIYGPDWRTVLSALLIVLAFPSWNLSPLLWFALVPWLLALERAPSKARAATQGLWLGILMSLGGFYWVAYVLSQFAGLPMPVSIVGLLLFSLINQPQFVLFSLLWTPLRRWLPGRRPRHILGLVLAASVIYTGIDWLLPKLFADTFGHAFHGSERIRQVADLGGAHLLTFLVVFTNLALLPLFRRHEAREWRPAAVAAALLAAAAIYGHFRVTAIRSLLAGHHPTARFAAIQANIGDFDKIAAESGARGAAHKVLSTFFSLSDQALSATPRPEVLLWPETSYPSTFRTPTHSDELARDQELERYVRERGVPVLFGGYDHLAGKDFNAFFFLSPRPLPGLAGQGDLQIYRKNQLLLFGEYIPGAETFKFITEAFPQVGNFGRGVGPEVMTVELEPARGAAPARQIRVGPVICYEVLFPEFVREAALKGSQLILNITNDSWFGPTAEPELHLSLSVFRSIELRIPMLRSTNTGISAVVLPDGNVTQATKTFEPAILQAEIPILPPVWTLVRAWGDWFGRLCAVLGALLLGICAWRGRRQLLRA